MHISNLRIRDFRCLASVDLKPAAGLNLVVGENASGKSSLLEAIYFLGRARSFRGTPAARLARRGQPGFSVVADAVEEGRAPRRIGVARQSGETRIKIGADAGASLFDLVSAMPVQIIDPNLHRLLEEGPSVRRRYLDWGVFHVEHAFFDAWRRYRRALKQRNSALRAGQASTVVVAWDAQLVHAAEEVDACRRRYIALLQAELEAMVRRILGEGELVLDYHAGWPRDGDFSDALVNSLARDRDAGYTHVGPHRADLRVRVDTVQARDWISRGQQKVLSAALLLGQAAVLDRQRQIKPVLLIDDIAAELGGTYREAILEAIQTLGCQCFLTFLDQAAIPANVEAGQMFHVEHGTVTSAT